DAAAMYGYAVSSAAAARLTSFSDPQQATSPDASGIQFAAVARAAATPAGTLDLGAWNPFAPGSVSDTTGLNGLLKSIFGTDTAFGQIINSQILATIF